MNKKNQIDQYLLGTLDPIALEAFRKKLEKDTELALAVKKRRAMIGGFEELGNQKMRVHIQSVRKNMLATKTTKLSASKSARRKFLRICWIAAASVALFFAGQYFFNKPETTDQLFQQAYLAPPFSFSTRELDGEEVTIQAEAYYKAKEYASALPLLKQLLAKHPEESNLKIACGNAHLAIGQTEEAILHFESIIQIDDPLFSDQARWYLALSYLKKGQVSKTKELLTQLAKDSKADFHKEAVRLLGKM